METHEYVVLEDIKSLPLFCAVAFTERCQVCFVVSFTFSSLKGHTKCSQQSISLVHQMRVKPVFSYSCFWECDLQL